MRRVAAVLAVLIAGAATLALLDWLAIRYVLQQVAQDYSLKQLALVLASSLVIAVSLRGARRLWSGGRPATVHVAGILLAAAGAAYWYRPIEGGVEYGYFVLARDLSRPWFMNLLLVVSVGAVGAVLPALATRIWRRHRSTS